MYICISHKFPDGNISLKLLNEIDEIKIIGKLKITECVLKLI